MSENSVCRDELVRISEREDLVGTDKYPYAKFPFDKFNKVQSGLFDVYDRDANFVIAASTSVGKTACSEMIAAHEINVNKGKVIYLSPLKSLSQEKLDDWVNDGHHFRDRKVFICTGDYRLTPDRLKEIDDSNIIIMTFEMLNSFSRNYKSSKNKFLCQVGLVVVDECHNIGIPGRGAHIESGIMKFTELNGKARFAMLSATMPNVDEIGRWMHSLNGKSTYLLQSDWRPCRLNVHYEKYIDVAFGYDENESRKVNLALQLVRKYPDDKFICFVHTKRTGELLLRRLEAIGVQCDYHHANLDKDRRLGIESRFRQDPKLRVIVATSGLASGINMPARRVVVLGIHRGLQEVETYEIVQAAGRAGRPQYDKEGDAHILVPTRKYEEHVKRLRTPTRIQSQMLDDKVLAFHLVSEIHHGNIRCLADVRDWYGRTLANFQKKKLDESVVGRVIRNLVGSGCVRDDGGNFSVTSAGVVASMFYYSPYDVADLARNFTRLFDSGNADRNLCLSMALGNVDSNRTSVVNSAERAEMEEYSRSVKKVEGLLSPKHPFTPGAIKAGYCYYQLLENRTSFNCNNYMRNFQMDFGRVAEVLGTFDAMGGRWGQAEFFKRLSLRINYGVADELTDFVRLKGIGKVKAKRLWASGMRGLRDLLDSSKVTKALNCSNKVAEELTQEARRLLG